MMMKTKSSINTNRKSTYALSNEPKPEHRALSPSPQKGAENRKMAVFRVKSHFVLIKSATKFLCVKTVSDKVVKHSLLQKDRATAPTQ